MKRLYLLLFIIWVGGCTLGSSIQLDSRYGKANPANRPVTGARHDSPSYWRDVKPILDRRCVVCHGCYDAPCQLKLSAYEGITRGASKTSIYSPGRLRAAQPSRLFLDARTTPEWRTRGFHPVLNEREQSASANIEAGVMARMLLLKNMHPLPQAAPLPQTFDFSLNRKQQCPTIEEFDVFEKHYPSWGMPFGLPALSGNEFRVLYEWLQAGAPSELAPALPAPLQARVAAWDYWSRDAAPDVQDFIHRRLAIFRQETGIRFQTDDPQRELYAMLRNRLAPVLNTGHDVVGDDPIVFQLQRLSSIRGQPLFWLPQVAFLSVNVGEQTRIYTLIHNNGMSNVSSLFSDDKRRLPSEDSLTVARGFVGAYLNAFYVVGSDDLEEFVSSVSGLDSEDDYRAFVDRFGIRRNDPRFWAHSDRLHDAYLAMSPVLER